MDMKELSSILQQNGIVGAGGAGFPTYAKLDTGAGRRGKICAAAVCRGAAGQRRGTADRTGALLRREWLSAAGNAAASAARAAGEPAAAASLFAPKTAGIPVARGLERESRAVKSRF